MYHTLDTTGYWENSDNKTAKTWEILAEIRDSIVKIEKESWISGFIADMGTWPELYEWNAEDGEWVLQSGGGIAAPGDPLYIEGYETQVLTGVPRSLWEKPDDNAARSDLWNGPYLAAPWGSGENQTPKDAWGKPLRFRLITVSGEEGGSEYLEVTSAGVDMTMDTSEELIVIIRDYEWKSNNLDRNTLGRIARTEALLASVKAAFLGDGAARDAAGRVIVGGYLADMGALPPIGIDAESGRYETTRPAWLWKSPYTQGASAPEGFSWRGAYYAASNNHQIMDPWDRPLIFSIINEGESLCITSAGPDGKTGEGFDEDNLSLVIEPEEWRAEEFSIEGVLAAPRSWKAVTTVVGYPDPENPENTVTVMHEPDLSKMPSWEVAFRLYAESGEVLELGTVNVSALEETKRFSLNVSACVCGERLLVAEQSGIEIARIVLQIGRGGTQSPVADRLTINADD